jgi:C-methyltransferase C-terminal domain/Putative zinc binding domain/Methyltransferase domain
MNCATINQSDSPIVVETKTSAAARQPPQYHCRHCDATLENVFVDLGITPLCESYLTAEQLQLPESAYPLAVYLCEKCLLVQLPTHATGEQIFTEYAYFSSYSTSYLEHARKNVATLIDRFQLNANFFVVELASNDGYLLRNFVQQKIPCLGIEPATNVAKSAEAIGVPTLNRFFGAATAEFVASQHRQADLIIANNVLAHVPDLHDFIGGIKLLLAPGGAAVVEIQHLLRLIEGNQFDTIYHEHFCYYTVTALIAIFNSHEMAVFDVEEIPTHGGSIRVFVCHADCDNQTTQIQPRVQKLLNAERAANLDRPEGYNGFAPKVAAVKNDLLAFLREAKQTGCSVAGYGAPGKGNTLLNFCGIGPDLLPYTVDRNPYKHGKFLPGSHVPIYPPDRIAQTRPDYVLILPWNLREEIASQLEYIREWGGKFVVPIPRLEVW